MIGDLRFIYCTKKLVAEEKDFAVENTFYSQVYAINSKYLVHVYGLQWYV